MQWVDESIADYEDLATAILDRYAHGNHHQPGDPAKLGQVIVDFSRRENPPLRLVLGSDAYEWVKGAYAERNAELEADETISRSTDLGPPTS